MTRDNAPDRDLVDRIRSSTAHWSFDRPEPIVATSNNRTTAPRYLAIAAVAIVAAALTVTAVAVVGRIPRLGLPSVGQPTSSPAVPSPNPRSAEPTVTPTLAPVSGADAERMCLDDNVEIQADWVQRGQSDDEVRRTLASLPIVHQDQRDHGGLFLFADDRFVNVCEIVRTASGDMNLSSSIGLREHAGGDINISGAWNSPESMGAPVADMMVFGEAAPDVKAVHVVLEHGRRLDAWLGDGLWIAWWNEPVGSVAIEADHANGTVTTTKHRMRAITLSG